jgi:hypothetical protein
MYKEGLARFATDKYQDAGLENKFAHLTNYSINKYSENFIENKCAEEDFVGSKRSLSYFRKLLAELNMSETYIFDQIKDIVIKTVLSIENIIVTAF